MLSALEEHALANIVIILGKDITNSKQMANRCPEAVARSAGII